MKKIFFLSSLIIVFISSPLAANEDKMAASEATDKLQKEQIDVHLENYGVRHIFENGSRQSIGLYKIIVGDPQKLKNAMSLNKSNGFDGLIFTTSQDKKDDWHKIRVHRPVKEKKGWKKSSIVKKDKLPYPFNTMADDLLNKIGTGFSDCEKIFDYIYQKKKQPQKTAGI
jgi:hypothetical protein